MRDENAVAAVTYRVIQPAELLPELFSYFIRRQEVTKCWRKMDGVWCIRDIPFVDDWTQEDYIRIAAQLRHTADTGGLVCGAFMDGALKGFASVEPVPFGAGFEYLDLPFLIVSADVRGCGIGSAMLETAKRWAKAHGAKKLYISAHSAVETQAFYRARGCTEATEYSAPHVEREPCDCQLESIL